MLKFVDPRSGDPVERRDQTYVNSRTGEVVAPVANGIPRFAHPSDNYAESFGYQWKKWHSLRSDLRTPGYGLKEEILSRTHFADFDLAGKTLLECGMGGGDDTEVLLGLPFAEVHAFDLSTSVDRACAYLNDPRLRIFQGSIYEIPYPEAGFDVLYCHRVLQHTPDPEEALRRICTKVRPGGLLFAHSYKRSLRHMAEWRYKYRWLTRRLPLWMVAAYVEIFGRALHRLNDYAYRNPTTKELAYRFVPFYRLSEGVLEGGRLPKHLLIELEKLITFDALTPYYDQPMTAESFCGIIEAAGFEILHLHDPESSPIYCTAVRNRIGSSI